MLTNYWQDYTATSHRHNRMLVTRCQGGDAYPGTFSFSILDTFSRHLSNQVAIQLEGFFKRKLGTRAFRLNAN